jgi:hypothetical protein
MDDHEFDAIIQEQQAEIDRKLDNPENCELTCREMDDGRVMSILRPINRGRERKTFVVSWRDEDGEVAHVWAEDLATDSFFQYMLLYHFWVDPTEGAVSPAMSEFFTFCPQGAPAFVNWARWLRIDHEFDDGIGTVDPEIAEILVESTIAAEVEDATLADQMRRAVRGEALGECDPEQMDLF